MDFPAYVPASIRDLVYDSIGIDGESFGVQQNNLNKTLRDIERLQKKLISTDSDEIRMQIAELIDDKLLIERNIECLNLIVFDERMRAAYSILTNELDNDEDLENFVLVAIQAKRDYRQIRDWIDTEKRLLDDVANAASVLLGKIQKFNDWSGGGGEFAGESLVVDLRRLETFCRNSPGFKNSPLGMAVASRQNNYKTQYLRAFRNLLAENFDRDRPAPRITSGIMKAMAITASVVINDPDIDVTYDDVRKALARPNNDTLENSVRN